MPYIGHSPEVAQRRYESIDDISGSFNGSTTSFALQVGGVTPSPFPVASENVLISVGGVIQEPDGGGTNGFQLTGTNIVFSSAPASGQSFFGVILAGADYVTAGHAFPDGDLASPSITFASDLDTGLFRPDSGALAFGGNGSEHARLDGSGRLLVGTSSGSGEPIAAFQGRSNDASDSGMVAITRSGTNPSGSIGELRFATGSDFDKYYGMIICASDGSTTSTSLPGVLRFSTTSSGSTSPTERLRVDSQGRLLVGTISAREHLNDGNDSTQISLEGTTQNTTTLSVVRNSNNDGPAHLVLGKSRGGSANSTTVLQDGDTIGHINFEGADGTHLIRAAQISCLVHGTPGANDMPGLLKFSTTPDGSNNLAEAMRIDRDGSVGIGITNPGEYHANANDLVLANGMTISNTSASHIYFADSSTGTGEYVGQVNYIHSGNYMQFITNNNEAVRIDSNGHLEVDYDSSNNARVQFGFTTGIWIEGNSSDGHQRFYTNSAVRILSGYNGQGTGFMNQSKVYPGTDNSTDLGSGSNRYDDVFATNGTIQTSDSRLKREVETSVLGIDFVKALRPVSYKWIEGKKVPIVDSTDENGENIYRTDADGNWVYESRDGARKHWGFIAQEVKQAVDDAGVDFAGWTLADKDDPDSTQSLRYEEFIAPLTKALQEAITKVETLEAQNTSQQTTIDTLQTQNTAQQATIDDLLARVTALEAA